MPVPVLIELKFDDKGAVTAVRRIGEEGEKSGKKVKDGLGQGEKAALSLKDQILATAAGFVTAQVAIGMVEKGFARLGQGMADAAARDRQLLGLTSTMRALGLDVERGSQQIDAYTRALQRAGFAGSETREAIQRFLPVTKNLESAIAATNIAQGLSVQTGREMTSIYEMVGGLLAGRVTESVALYGVTIDKTKTQAQQAASALQQLAERTKGVAENADDAAAAQNRFNILLNNLWTNTGKEVNSSLQQTNALLTYIGADLDTVSEAARRVIISLSTMGSSEFFKALPMLHAKAQEAAKVGDINAKIYKDADIAAMQAAFAAQELANKEAELAARSADTSAAEAELEKQHRAAAEGAKVQQKAIDELTSSMATLYEERKIVSGQGGGGVGITPDMVPTENFPIGVSTGNVIPDPQVVAADSLLFLQAYQDNYLTPLQQLELDYQNAKVDAAQKGTDRVKAIDQAYYSAKRQMQAMMLAQQLSDFGTALMGAAQHNKQLFKLGQAAAISGATIDTIRAAIAAFKNAGGWPWGVLPMATTLAMGYAKIAQIKAQKPPAYEQGTPYVPRTQMALVHEGEAITPAKFNPFGPDGNLRGGAVAQAGTTINVTIDASGAWFDSQERVNEMARRVEDAVRRGYVRRSVA